MTATDRMGESKPNARFSASTVVGEHASLVHGVMCSTITP
jgi:hypothetical protein